MLYPRVDAIAMYTLEPQEIYILQVWALNTESELSICSRFERSRYYFVS
jgi:hypothetical protein